MVSPERNIGASSQIEATETRASGHKRLERAVDLLEVINGEDSGENESNIQDPETRVNFLKNLDGTKLLDLLCVANSLLTGGKLSRWQGESVKTVISMAGAIDLEPPDNAHEEFSKVFESLKSELTVEKFELTATKLYVAIIFAHMFADGNGRLARNAYSLIKDGKLLPAEKSSVRGAIIQNFCERINVESIYRLMVKNGIHSQERGDDALNYIANETNDVGLGYTAQLKFIAACRAGLCPEGSNRVYGDNWTQDQLQSFRAEYQAVLREWYNESQTVISEYEDWSCEQLRSALG